MNWLLFIYVGMYVRNCMGLYPVHNRYKVLLFVCYSTPLKPMYVCILHTASNFNTFQTAEGDYESDSYTVVFQP